MRVPPTLTLTGEFAPPKVKETPAERKARLALLPKLTPAERVARMEERLAKMKTKLQAGGGATPAAKTEGEENRPVATKAAASAVTTKAKK